MGQFNRTFHRGLYRSRYGIILGVCRGLAEYFDISIFWTRAGVLLLLIVTGFWPTLVLYIIAALLMKKEPYSYTHRTRRNRSYTRNNRPSRSQFEGVKTRFSNLERRMRNVEDIVTSKEFDWDMRLNA